MTPMTEARRRHIHGPIRPLDYPGRRTYRAYREVRAEEARLAREAGEEPQPGMLNGTAYALCALLCLGVWLGGLYLIFGGSL